MKGRSFALAIMGMAALAAVGGCKRPGSGRAYPLVVTDATGDPQAAAFVAELNRQAMATDRFRPARDKDGERAVTLTVRSLRSPVEVDGREGFTYFVDWTIKDGEIGGQKGDCHAGKLNDCSYWVVYTMIGHLWPQRAR